jgi:signal transduction histidine kinase
LGFISPQDTLPPILAPFAPFLSAGFWIGIFWTVAGLTYVLSNSLQRALKSSRAQAQELQELSASLEARVQSQTAELVEQSRQAAIQSQEAAIVEERARVARDIHDTLAQGLTGIVVQLGAAQRAMQVTEQDTDPTSKEHADAHRAAIEHLALAQGMAREALAEARRSIWNLRASSLERGELRDALAGLAARASNETTRVNFGSHGEPWQLNANVESALLRVAQEGLVNAAKHSGATEVDVTLEYGDDAVRLEIHDNGVGLDDEALNDANAIKNPASGFGLMGMRERLAQWGGELKLTNEDGAKVEAAIPRRRAERLDTLREGEDLNRESTLRAV